LGFIKIQHLEQQNYSNAALLLLLLFKMRISITHLFAQLMASAVLESIIARRRVLITHSIHSTRQP
jgi:hypothetical protein